jgi:hypothetical protein
MSVFIVLHSSNDIFMPYTIVLHQLISFQIAEYRQTKSLTQVQSLHTMNPLSNVDFVAIQEV